MAELIYSTIQSLDGYVADADGDFSWGRPDEEVHAFFNDLMRSTGTHLYGRRMYEVMKVWERPEDFPEMTPVFSDFSDLWRAADKVVYSRTLESPATARTRIERDFEPDAVRELKRASERDLTVSGPTLASEAFRAGLVDDCRLVLAPVIVGAGTRSLPSDVRVDLELVDERRFRGGMVYLRYRTR